MYPFIPSSDSYYASNMYQMAMGRGRSVEESRQPQSLPSYILVWGEGNKTK